MFALFDDNLFFMGFNMVVFMLTVYNDNSGFVGLILHWSRFSPFYCLMKI